MEEILENKGKRKLHLRQRDFLAGFFEKISLVAFTVLVVEPVVNRAKDQPVNWPVSIVSLIGILIIISYAVRLKTPDNNS